MALNLTLLGNRPLTKEQYDGSLPMLQQPLCFPALTGNSTEGKAGIKDRHAEATLKQLKRKELERDPSPAAWAQLVKMSPPREEDLEPLEGRVMVCHPMFENCPHRVLGAYGTSYGYKYIAFPTRADLVEAMTESAMAKTDNYWFPIIEFETALYWFVDFDEDRKPKPSQSNTELEYYERCHLGMNFLRRCAEYLYGGINLTEAGKSPCEPHYVSACSVNKHSFHAHMKIAFESVKALCLVMGFARGVLERAPKSCALVQALLSANPKSERGNPWIIDFPIYNGNRNFRGCGQTKHGKKDALLPWDGQKRMIDLDERSMRRWVKRSLILLKKDQHLRILTLPEPPIEPNKLPWQPDDTLTVALEKARAFLYGRDDPLSQQAICDLENVPQSDPAAQWMPLVMRFWQRDRKKALPHDLFDQLREMRLPCPPTGEQLFSARVLKPCLGILALEEVAVEKSEEAMITKKAKKTSHAPLPPTIQRLDLDDHMWLHRAVGQWNNRGSATKVHGYH
jgi:hypothetical protein